MSQTYIRKGMVLCAGLGTRLLPITEKLPKPLVPILNVENVLFNIYMLQKAGIKEIVVNLHHLPNPLEQFLSSHPAISSKLTFLREPVILGTGGGVKNAEHFFSNEPFVLANCDFVTNIDISLVISKHQNQKNLATMVLIQDESRQKKYSKVGVDQNGKICSLPKLQISTPSKHGIFTGIHVIEPYCLQFLKNEPCGINDLMYPALMREHPERIGGVFENSRFWLDTGEVDTLLSSTNALLSLLKEQDPFKNTIEALLGYNLIEHEKGCWAPSEWKKPANVRIEGSCLVGRNPSFENEVILGNNVVVGDDAKIQGPVKLSNCVVLPGATVAGCREAYNSLVFERTLLTGK